MRCYTFPAVVSLAAMLAVACGEQPTGSPLDPAFNRGVGSPPAARNFTAPLDSRQEVAATPVVSQGTGVGIFQLNREGTELSYKLIVANIENVTQAHIHLAPAGANGPVVAWLYPSGPPSVLIPGRSDGILAEGVITGDDLVGPLVGLSLDDLLAAMRAGNTYVNVHTLQFPPGEIRGQIKAGGPNQ
jgi:hypothetical protein